MPAISCNAGLISFSSAAFGLGPVEDGFHLGLVVVFQDGEDGVEFFERSEQRLYVVLADFALAILVLASFGGVERGVGFAQHVEDGGLGFGGVQVVVESGGDAVGGFVGQSVEGGVRAVGEVGRPSAAKAASVVRPDGTTEVVPFPFVPFAHAPFPSVLSAPAPFPSVPFARSLAARSRRKLKLRSFSTELAADFSPSKVKFSWLR